MIRFLRAIDLSDYVGNEKQMNFCLLPCDLEKVQDAPLLDGLVPSALILDIYANHQQEALDLAILRDCYLDELDSFTALATINSIINVNLCGWDVNVVCNTGSLCRMCVDELSARFLRKTQNVEVLL